MFKLTKILIGFVLVGLILSIQLTFSVTLNQQSDDFSQLDEYCLHGSYEQLLPPQTNTEGAGERQLEQSGSSGFRTLSDDAPSRILHFNQLSHLFFLNQDINYLVILSQREKKGYYLYQLCKLLI
jgi:hypothetical protein